MYAWVDSASVSSALDFAFYFILSRVNSLLLIVILFPPLIKAVVTLHLQFLFVFRSTAVSVVFTIINVSSCLRLTPLTPCTTFRAPKGLAVLSIAGQVVVTEYQCSVDGMNGKAEPCLRIPLNIRVSPVWEG